MAEMRSAEYNRDHARVRRERGAADHNACVDCGRKARDWSFNHGENAADPMSYSPRCRSCHMKYDGPFGAALGKPYGKD